MKTALQRYSLIVCLACGFIIAFILTLHTVMVKVPPYFDGQGYIMRGYALYGYLHTGQWHNFWIVLTSPAQSVLPCHYILFFLLPRSLAGFASYVALNNLVTFLMLACAVFFVSQVLNRREWAPTLFLLTAVNNVAFNEVSLFYLDMPFMALGLLTIGLQMKAWQSNRLRFRLLAGLALGALFFIKPANALIFLATYSLSEVIYVTLETSKPGSLRFGKSFLSACKGWLSTALAFIPMLYLALLCGGVQTILQLIDQNEVGADQAAVEGNPLLRLFYFPLCLSAYYNVLLLLFLLAMVAVYDRCTTQPSKSDIQPVISHTLCLPILIAFLVLGEFFSFGMLVKPLRSLILVVPLIWFVFFWFLERRGFRVHLLLFMALAYALLAFSQTYWTIFSSSGPSIERAYQLGTYSWWEMPPAWNSSLNYYQVMSHRIKQKLPAQAVICTTSITTRSVLIWELESPDLLQGAVPRYEVRNLLNYKGEYLDNALVGANVIAAITESPDLDEINQTEAANIYSYGRIKWVNNGDKGWFLGKLENSDLQLGGVFVLNQPLTQLQVDNINRSAPFKDMSSVESSGDNFIGGRHYSRDEAWRLLAKWYARRFN